MTKYSNEFKVKAIKMVLKGDSISHVAKILNMQIHLLFIDGYLIMNMVVFHNFFIKIVNILLSLSKKLLNISGSIIYH